MFLNDTAFCYAGTGDDANVEFTSNAALADVRRNFRSLPHMQPGQAET